MMKDVFKRLKVLKRRSRLKNRHEMRRKDKQTNAETAKAATKMPKIATLADFVWTNQGLGGRTQSDKNVWRKDARNLNQERR